jgi:hypothetical protein
MEIWYHPDFPKVSRRLDFSIAAAMENPIFPLWNFHSHSYGNLVSI